MSIFKKKGIIIASATYWFLLLYIIAALVWWFIALQHQNHQMYLHRLLELKADDPAFAGKSAAVIDEEGRKRTQYIGEGISFLLVIIAAAVYIYRAVRRQLRVSHQQQNFMMAVTHELKTPIAVAKLNLETLQKHKLEEVKQQKLIKSTLDETERLHALANNILVSAQLEGRAYKIERTELDFSELVSNCIGDFRGRFPAREFELSGTQHIAVKGDALLLQMLVNNLLENAIKYSPDTSVVYTTVSQKDHIVKLSVADHGPGIADTEKKKIFERFYRIGNEQQRRTRGTGLGLYLCKKIAADHHASIHVMDNLPTGSIFTVQFHL